MTPKRKFFGLDQFICYFKAVPLYFILSDALMLIMMLQQQQRFLFKEEEMITFSILLLVTIAYSQLTTSNGGVSMSIFQTNTLLIQVDSSSPFYPSDFYRNVVIVGSHLYALGSNNIVQIYNIADLSLAPQVFANYSYSSSPPYCMVYLSVDENESLMVLTSFSNSKFEHLVFSLNSSKVGAYLNKSDMYSFSTQPEKVFIKENKVFAYFSNPSSNDQVSIWNMLTNTSTTINLPVSTCHIALCPDRAKALIWNKYSTLYIYSILGNFSLLSTYTQAISTVKDKTNSISCSSDSQLAILETDQKKPLKIVNLTSYQTAFEYSCQNTIQFTCFLDSIHRFVLISESSSKNVLYDTTTGIASNITGTLTATSLKIDVTSNHLFGISANSIVAFGINASEGSNILMTYPIIVSSNQINTSTEAITNTTTTNTTVTNTTATDTTVTNTTVTNQTVISDTTSVANQTSSQTSDNTNKDPSQSSSDSLDIDPTQFYLQIVYTEAENKTLTKMEEIIYQINLEIKTVFALTFSSPLAVFFLSLFNYFYLSSLYILLNLKIPYSVYYYLSQLYDSCSSDFLTELGAGFKLQPLSSEMVTDQRPLYFNVTSDLISGNLTPISIIVGNIIFYELLIWISQKCFGRTWKPTKTLKHLRSEIYWGLIVSSVVPIILPWKYIAYGGISSFISKLNLCLFYLVISTLFFLLVVSFLLLLHKIKRRIQVHPIKTTLREWWEGYQNYLYPLFVLLENPVYFLVVIGISNIFSFYNSFYVPKWKVFSMMKASYPILFHVCFLIFYISKEDAILAMTSIACLGVFLLGSIHHILSTVVAIVHFFVKTVKNACKKTKSKTCFRKKAEATGCEDATSFKQRPQNVVRKNKEMNIRQIIAQIEEQLKSKGKKMPSKTAIGPASKDKIKFRGEQTKTAMKNNRRKVKLTRGAKNHNEITIISLNSRIKVTIANE